MKQPKVSVVIPSYNYAHFLDDAITSVLEQTFTDFELIIVDNHSTDDTDEVVKKYLRDYRVRYHKNDRNLGLVGNWNRCLEYASGEYVKFLCADDKIHPQMLRKFVAVMEHFPSVSIVSSYNQWFGDRHKKRKTPFKGLIRGAVAKSSMIGKPNWLFAPSANMFRADCIKNHRFHPQLHALIDIEFYQRLLSEGDCYVIPEVLSFTRVHNETVSASRLTKKNRHTLERYRFMRILKETNPNEDQHFHALVDAEVKQRAIKSVAVMYKVSPKLYKKENRAFFKESFKIGISEGVHFQAIEHYLNSCLGKFRKKIFKKFSYKNAGEWKPDFF